jgi:membrane protein required for colicin V production
MTIDILAAFVAAYGFYLGFTKGIIKALFGIIAVFIGLIAALKLSPFFVSLLEKLAGNNNPLLFLVGFALTFVLTLFLIRFIGNRFEDLLKAVKINFFNQVVGGVALCVLFLVLFSYGIWFANQIKVIPEKTKKASYTYAYLETLPEQSRELLAKTKPLFKEFSDKFSETIGQVKNK